ncbi:MAG: hypothetical protein ABIR71_01460 [Chthoniobacterales bacterium]
MKELQPIIEHRRLAAPATTPQALAWHDGALWISSRDLRSFHVVDPESWTVREEFDVPGIPWAATSVGDALWFNLGEGRLDDRWLHHYVPGEGFTDREQILCPDYTGSYLSYDGDHVHLSQWYKGRILRLDDDGEVLRRFEVRMEISGHAFVDGFCYVLRGFEAPEEAWRIARFDPEEHIPRMIDLAAVPFPCRSLTHDGERFWTNHRDADQVVSFTLPASP